MSDTYVNPFSGADDKPMDVLSYVRNVMTPNGRGVTCEGVALYCAPGCESVVLPEARYALWELRLIVSRMEMAQTRTK